VGYVVVLRQKLTRYIECDGIGTVLAQRRLEDSRHVGERLVPTGLRCFAARAAANQRMQEPSRAAQGFGQREALRAQAAGVGGMMRIARDLERAVRASAGDDSAAHPAVGAGRTHVTGHPELPCARRGGGIVRSALRAKEKLLAQSADVNATGHELEIPGPEARIAVEHHPLQAMVAQHQALVYAAPVIPEDERLAAFGLGKVSRRIDLYSRDFELCRGQRATVTTHADLGEVGGTDARLLPERRHETKHGVAVLNALPNGVDARIERLQG